VSLENLIAVIGDIHGCLYTLKAMYSRIAAVTQNVYSVGDIIDRGNHISDTVRFFIDNNIFSVRGNHEDMLLKAIEDYNSIFAKMHIGHSLANYFRNGGNYTMKSYIDSDEPGKFDEFIEAISSYGHLDYIKSFPLKREFEKVIITHAGIIKGASEYNMLWNREIPSDLGKLQVYGHTPVSEPEICENRYLNLDTGCVYGRSLTGAIINTKTGEIIEILQEKLKKEDISDTLPRIFGL